MYTCCCNEQGFILDDLIVYRRASDDLLVVCNASNISKISAHFAQAATDHCDFEDSSDSTALLALQGPKAATILEKAGCPEANTLGPFRLGDFEVAGVSCTVARTGYTGEDGAEIFCQSEQAAELWRGLLEAGRDVGLQPVGLGARDTLRLEARLSLYGNDIDETTNPIEAGLGWTVKLDADDFIGKAALQAIKAQGTSRKLIGFEMTGRGIARHGYPLLDTESTVIGSCTSGGPGPTVGKNIGLGYVPAAQSRIGTPLLVDCRGKKVPAVIVKTPFYKRPKLS